MGCDANAPSITWGSMSTNTRGECLLQFSLETDFEVLNTGNTPTFVTKIRQEVIDITISPTNIPRYVSEWKASSEPSLSDHKIIEFRIEEITPMM